MSLEPASPAGSGSGRSSPIPRTARRGGDGDLLKRDKGYRRYAAGIEKALATFESPQQEWSDYIAFLARLVRAIQAIQHVEHLPHSTLVALRLGQCMNPALPAGVHQKALEVYSAVFTLIGKDGLCRNLHEFLPGLLPTLSFASLTVRPLFYALLEHHVLKLDSQTLRPTVKSVILALLPGIEDETSEDFEEGMRMLDKVRSITMQDAGLGLDEGDDGYFWQCFFLASITSASRRQGALAFLFRRLPLLGATNSTSESRKDETLPQVSSRAEAIISPDPGLLVRCFATGLQDTTMLVQRGFLDLLVTHIPLHSAVLQSRVEPRDAQILVSAAVTVVLRRDMSLNRRLWSWFLGPDSPSSDYTNDLQPKSPSSDMDEGLSINQANYFQQYGARFLQESIIVSLERSGGSPAEKARPFRVCLSLMDRWEVGASLVPTILLPALESAFACSQNVPLKHNDEVLRSASLFFDGVESSLIWGKIIEQLDEAFEDVKRNPTVAETKLEFLTFIIQRFNVRDEEMLTRHIPNTVLIVLYSLCHDSSEFPVDAETFLSKTVDFVYTLILMLPSHAFGPSNEDKISADVQATTDRCSGVVQSIRANYKENREKRLASVTSTDVGVLIVACTASLCARALDSQLFRSRFAAITDALCSILTKCPQNTVLHHSELYDKFKSHLIGDRDAQGFSTIHAILALVAASRLQSDDRAFIDQSQLLDLQPLIMEALWPRLSPWEPKYHVEAVRLIWQLESLTRTQKRTGAQLTRFVTARMDQHSAEQEECARFATLWEHTMQSQQTTRTERPTGPLMRRVSSMANIHELHGVNPEAVLTRPLLALLDSLTDPTSDACTFLLSWLRQLPSLDRVFSVLFTQLARACTGLQELAEKHSVPNRNRRDSFQHFRLVESTLRHILNILRLGSSHAWEVLAELRPQNSDQDAITGIQYIASTCASLVRDSAKSVADAQLTVLHQALPLLQELLDSQYASTLKYLQLEDDLIDALVGHLRHPSGKASGVLQTIFLKTITKALKLRLTHSSHDPEPPVSGLLPPTALRPSSIEKGRRPSLQEPNAPPAQLLDCIKTGLSSPSSRLFIDHWVQFLSDILPLYFDAIFSAMIPLVECFCEQINLAFQYVQSTFDRVPFPHDPIPVSTLAALLHGLELILANAHVRLQRQDIASPTGKSSESGGSFFGSMVPGAFSTAGAKSSKVNSRLTVILCIQDALKTCFAIWRWATHSAEGPNIDPTSVATLSFNSLKLRHRTKRILEHLFAAENLECLETLTVQWLATDQDNHDGYDKSDVFSLLHVLTASRPRVTLPSILNSLYSRTSIEALDVSKRSSLTSDLTALDVAAFLLRYITTIEDDAMDEIWADCTNFLKDVLSNPLPHRQMLPALLELVSLLAQKIDNTNIGELKRMHREIGVSNLSSMAKLRTNHARTSSCAFLLQLSRPVHRGALLTVMSKKEPVIKGLWLPVF